MIDFSMIESISSRKTSLKNLRLACFIQFVFSFQETEIIKSAKMNFSTVNRQNFLRYIATVKHELS